MRISQECIRINKDRCDKIIINDRDIVELDNLLSNMYRNEEKKWVNLK